jgi:hypothetical protein
VQNSRQSDVRSFDNLLFHLTTTVGRKVGFVQATTVVLLIIRTPKQLTVDGLPRLAVRMLDEQMNVVDAFLLFSALLKREWSGDTDFRCLHDSQSLSNVLTVR